MTVANTKLSPQNESRVVLGQNTSMPVTNRHYVNGRPIMAPYQEASNEQLELEEVLFGLGCFWGAERKFWNTEGVYTTAVGYAAGTTTNPSYQEVCTGATGHAEVVLVVFDPQRVTFAELLKVFFESHDPTQGMRQGNDIGSQYRSGIYCVSGQQVEAANKVLAEYQRQLTDRGYGKITTEVKRVERFFYAEEYHQQYLAKNPNGYCGIGGTGVSCAI